MKFTLHLGAFKTGTSSLQSALFNNRSELLEYGILYPKTGISGKATSIGHRHSKFAYGTNQSESYRELLNQLDTEIMGHSVNHCIMSSEAFSLPAKIPSLNLLVSHLNNHYDGTVFGIIYLRNVCRYTIALYREWVRRWGETRRYNEFVSHRAWAFDFVSLLEKMSNIFDSKLEVASYQEVDDIVDDFCERVNISNIMTRSISKKNKTLNALDIEVIRQLNSHQVSPEQKARVMTRLEPKLANLRVNKYQETLTRRTLSKLAFSN
ncbi:hypothetical protein [Idiomarina sp.]|uniref:hypothetical protein n=1 Tax=Idiomarina sp. TaxID=1874361 RepID=UPI0025BB3220|nr:hypothetical protein [Idiomarina sp.]NQZ04540.1 hypothetical protein [Idiomarina sp.]